MTMPRHDLPAGCTGPARPGKGADKALAMMIQALELLDLEGGAELAGAHLDLAIHRLRESIAGKQV